MRVAFLWSAKWPELSFRRNKSKQLENNEKNFFPCCEKFSMGPTLDKQNVQKVCFELKKKMIYKWASWHLKGIAHSLYGKSYKQTKICLNTNIYIYAISFSKKLLFLIKKIRFFSKSAGSWIIYWNLRLQIEMAPDLTRAYFWRTTTNRQTWPVFDPARWDFFWSKGKKKFL